MYLLDGVPQSPDVAFEKNDVIYPPGWIQSATPPELAYVGITWVADEPMPDPFYSMSHADPVEPWKWVSVPFTPAEMKPRLDLYSQQRRDMRINGGIEHTIGAETYKVPTDPVTRLQFFNYRVIQERPGGPTTTPASLMLNDKEVVLALTEAQLLGVEVKMETRIYDCYAVQLTLQQGIQDETITTKEQIDTAYAAVP